MSRALRHIDSAMRLQSLTKQDLMFSRKVPARECRLEAVHSH
jgi:hypothetical protein